jgi:putative flippase GtrA
VSHRTPVAAARSPLIFARNALASGLIVRYLLVAVVKVALDFAIFNVLVFGVADPDRAHLLLANSSGFVAAGWVAYRLNSGFAFRVERRPGDFGRFLAVSLVGGALYNVGLIALVATVDASGSVELNLAKLGALAVSAGWNFLGCSLFVFRCAGSPATTPVHGRNDAA